MSREHLLKDTVLLLAHVVLERKMRLVFVVSLKDNRNLSKLDVIDNLTPIYIGICAGIQ